jgi:hypothetical protein
LQVKPGIGSYLRRLEHDDQEAIMPQLNDNGLLVAAAGLDPDPFDPMSTQPG